VANTSVHASRRRLTLNHCGSVTDGDDWTRRYILDTDAVKHEPEFSQSTPTAMARFWAS
jgi:hypothetical protein